MRRLFNKRAQHEHDDMKKLAAALTRPTQQHLQIRGHGKVFKDVEEKC